MKILRNLTFVLCASLSVANAGIEDSMSEFWDSLGGTSNINKARFVEGQKSGHISLGGIQMRSNVQNAQIASMQTPSIRADCGGIDFYAGGFSFISSDQLIALGKSIVSNAPGALAQLALDNISPQLGEIQKYFQDVAREVNKMNINSCNAAKSLISSPSGTLNTIKSHGCRTWGLASGKYQDASDANANCTSGGHASQTTSPESEKVTNTNIAWEALKEANIVDVGNEDSILLGELYMTLSGTVIISGGETDNDGNNFEVHPAKVANDNMISALLTGSKISKLKCDDKQKCLIPTIDEIELTSDKSYKSIVDDSLTNILEHIQSNGETELSSQSEKLLYLSSLPVLKLVSVNFALDQSSSEIYSLSEYIALDLLYQYLDSVMYQMRKASDKYNKDPYKKVFTSFFEEQALIMSSIDQKKSEVSKKYENYILMLERAISIEEKLHKVVSKDMRLTGK
jgi:conjugative transfer pilus assembly protein TraH